MLDNSIIFVNDNAEDFKYLADIEALNGKIFMSDEVMYNVDGHNYENNDDCHLIRKKRWFSFEKR